MSTIWTWLLALTFYQQITAVTLAVVLCMAVLWFTMTMLIRLFKALSAFLRESDIKKVGAGGIEFYDDKTTTTKPRRTPRKKVVK